MIVKLGESLIWENFKRRTRVVRARRMTEDFLYETQHGWVQGHKGQWLVEMGERLRCNLDNEAFLRCHTPVKKNGDKVE